MKLQVNQWVYMGLILTSIAMFLVTLNSLILGIDNLKNNLPLALNILSIILMLIILFDGIVVKNVK